MTIQQLSLEAVQKIRQYLQSSLVMPDSENYPPVTSLSGLDQEPPEPGSLDALGDLFKFAVPAEETTYTPNAQGQWFVSVVNPGSALIKLPGVTLKSGFRLVTYLYRLQEHGVGATWAVPEAFSTTTELERLLGKGEDQTQPPRPPSALPDFMGAIEGDRSVSSFIITSLLRRELQEFGALGKFRTWTHHRLINTVPPQVPWKWQTQAPANLAPKVRFLPDGKAAVEFFSCRVVAPIALFRHIDLYPIESYQANMVNQAIATP